MTSTTSTSVGSARVCPSQHGPPILDAQTDALTAAGVDPARAYSEKLTGTSTRGS